MTTRLELRTAVRLKLEDTSESPLWDDTTLNDLLTEALHLYGARFPLQQSSTVSVTDGATTVVVTPDLTADQVVRVFDGNCQLVPRQQAFESDAVGACEQAWRWWGTSLVLAQGAAVGTWTIDFLATRTLPDDDVSAVDLIAGDEEIVILLAASGALRRRAIEDGKRGLGRNGRVATAETAESLRMQAETLILQRRRRVKGGWIEPT